MARAEAGEKDFFIRLSEKEIAELEISPGAEFEILKGKKGIYILIEKQATEAEKLQKIDAHIYLLVREKPLNERVEGKFEKLLNKEELKRLEQLLKEGKVIPFRLSKKYAKAVYKLPESEIKESESNEAKEKSPGEYSLQKDGFLIVKGEDEAKKLSFALEHKIREGAIRGLRGFDGLFYIIETALYEKYREPVLKVIEAHGTIELELITQSVKISPALSRIVCEFLTDEGEIIEKRRNLFGFVK